MYHDRIYVKVMKVFSYNVMQNANAKMVCLIGKLALSWKSRSKILDDFEKYCCRTKAESFTKYVGVITGVPYMKVFKREWFESSIMLEFEGKQYSAPVGYDAFLKEIYGDYMRLPPEDKRCTNHSFEAWIRG